MVIIKRCSYLLANRVSSFRTAFSSSFRILFQSKLLRTPNCCQKIIFCVLSRTGPFYQLFRRLLEYLFKANCLEHLIFVRKLYFAFLSGTGPFCQLKRCLEHLFLRTASLYTFERTKSLTHSLTPDTTK